MSYPPVQPQPIVLVQSKSNIVAYLLWFFFGSLGIHKLYLKQFVQAIIYAGLLMTGLLFWIFGMGWLFHVPLSILLFIDLFIIPGRVNSLNYQHQMK